MEINEKKTTAIVLVSIGVMVLVILNGGEYDSYRYEFSSNGFTIKVIGRNHWLEQFLVR